MVGLQPRFEKVQAPPPEVGAASIPAEASNAAVHATPYEPIRAPWHIRHGRLIATTAAAVLVIGAAAYVAYDVWLTRSLDRLMAARQLVVPDPAPVVAPEPPRATPVAAAPARPQRPSPPIASRPAPAPDAAPTPVADPAPSAGPRPPSVTHTQREAAAVGAAAIAAAPAAAKAAPARAAPSSPAASSAPAVCTEGVAALGLCTVGK